MDIANAQFINEIKDRANNMYGDIITILYKIFSNI